MNQYGPLVLILFLLTGYGISLFEANKNSESKVVQGVLRNSSLVWAGLYFVITVPMLFYKLEPGNISTTIYQQLLIAYAVAFTGNLTTVARYFQQKFYFWGLLMLMFSGWFGFKIVQFWGFVFPG